MSEFKYRGICHTTCYWLDTLWEIGEVYEGNIPPNKHFSEDGKKDAALPPPNAGSDRRSNLELREAIEDFGVNVPKSWTRKKLWARLKELEEAEARDALTSVIYGSPCGFEAKSKAGAATHERQCEECQKIINAPEEIPEG